MPKSAYVHSGRVFERIPTLSPRSMPSSWRPSETSLAIWPSSGYETSTHSPVDWSLNFWATFAACFSTARGSRSASVFEPVAASLGVVAV